MQITHPSSSDLEGVVRLLAELSQAMGDAEELDPAALRRNLHIMLSDPHMHLWVAKDEERVIGFLSLHVHQTSLHAGPSGLIDELVVTQDHRGMGLGKQLIDTAIATCRQLDCAEVSVSTLLSNRPARDFYKRCGFSEDSALLELHLK